MTSSSVESTTLSAVAYDRFHLRLWLTFRSGAMYCYDGVPAEVHERLLAAPSKGAYFNKSVRARFPFQKITRIPAPHDPSD